MEKTKNISYPKTVPNPNIQLEYNFNQNQNLNLAEKNALIQIENTKKLEDLRKSKQKEFEKKYNEKRLSYHDEQKKKNEEEEFNKKSQNLDRIQRMQNFNKTLYEKNMKKKIINNNKNLIWIKPENIKNKTQNKNKINNENIINNEKKLNKEIIVVKHDNDTNNDIVNLQSTESNFIKKKTILLKSESNDNININISVNENENENENSIVKKEESKENLKNKNNENIIDLRRNIQFLLNSKLSKKENDINNEDQREQINEKINELRQFRYDGTLPEKNIHSEKESKKHIIKNKKFLSEFEKKRYIKALKNIFTERLGEHNIYIQNICSCGNLQKQLTALVERGHITIYALTNIECANNCIFYKNKKEYMKCIYDILNSIKNIKYENFHNKYK